MGKITHENFESQYVDPIEEQQIDKFVCDEMGRQIHRYIKGMSGTKQMMLRFEAQLSTLDTAGREQAIARYIDLNRKVLSGLDLRIVLTRAMANYCDTFSYFIKMVNDTKRTDYYMQRIEQKYKQFHEVYEDGGRYGIKDHQGRVLVEARYDFLRTCYVYVDDLMTMPVIAQKDGKMGLVVPDGNGTIVAPFEYDDISLRDEYPYFEARKGRTKGYLDQHGTFVKK